MRKTLLILSFSLLLLALQLHFELRAAAGPQRSLERLPKIRSRESVIWQPSQVVEAVLPNEPIIRLPSDWAEAYEGEHVQPNPILTFKTFFLPHDGELYQLSVLESKLQEV